MYNGSHNPNYYEILGIPRTASREDIKTAYRKLAKDYHPDKLLGVSEAIRKLAEDKFKEITQAYEVLTDTEKRRDYDHKLQTASDKLKKQELIRQIQELFENNDLEGAVRVAKSLYELFPDDSECQEKCQWLAQIAFEVASQLAEKEELDKAESYFRLAIDISTDVDFTRRVKGDIGLLRSRRKEEPLRSSATERESAEKQARKAEEKRKIQSERTRKEKEKIKLREEIIIIKQFTYLFSYSIVILFYIYWYKIANKTIGNIIILLFLFYLTITLLNSIIELIFRD